MTRDALPRRRPPTPGRAWWRPAALPARSLRPVPPYMRRSRPAARACDLTHHRANARGASRSPGRSPGGRGRSRRPSHVPPKACLAARRARAKRRQAPPGRRARPAAPDIAVKAGYVEFPQGHAARHADRRQRPARGHPPATRPRPTGPPAGLRDTLMSSRTSIASARPVRDRRCGAPGGKGTAGRGEDERAAARPGPTPPQRAPGSAAPSNMRRAPAGALAKRYGGPKGPRVGSRAGRFARRARGVRRRRRRRVLELLLGAEQGVERLLAQILAHDQGHDRADDHEQQQLAETAALLLVGLRRLVQRDRRVPKDSAAALMSFWSFLSSKTCLVGFLPFCSRPTALRADSYASMRFWRSSSSVASRWTYGLFFTAIAAPPALAAVFFAPMPPLIGPVASLRRAYPGDGPARTRRAARARIPNRRSPTAARNSPRRWSAR